MIIYLVEMTTHEGSKIDKAFLNKEKAKIYCHKLNKAMNTDSFWHYDVSELNVEEQNERH